MTMAMYVMKHPIPHSYPFPSDPFPISQRQDKDQNPQHFLPTFFENLYLHTGQNFTHLYKRIFPFDQREKRLRVER